MKYVTKESKPEETLIVSLKNEQEGVSVMVGDYYIVTIRQDGRVVRHRAVSKDTGLNLDSRLRVVVEDE